MLYLMAEFVVGGRQYIYQSPVQVHVGQYVLVNVCGEIKAVHVVSVSTERDDDYEGPIKSIVGVGYMLEDLEQPVKRESSRSQSLLSRFFQSREY
jgi:hypothetical protein